MKKVYVIVNLVLAFTLVSCFFIVSYFVSQSMPQPSEPEFSLKFLHSDVPIGGDGNSRSNNTIVVEITNQPTTNIYQIFYNIRIKNHSAPDWQWTELYPNGTYYEQEYTSYMQKHLVAIRDNTPSQSSGEYTVVPLSYYNPPIAGEGISFPIEFNSTIDVQVRALVGHSTWGWVANVLSSPTLGGQFTTVTALDTTSGWSPTQTITISEE